MKKRLSKYGNSLALIIDKPILELLNIKEDTLLKITTDGTSITIFPLDKGKKTFKKEGDMKVSGRKDVQKSFEKILKLYEPALKKLAKS